MTDGNAVTFDALLAQARPRETVVTICVAGDLAGEHEALVQRLSEVGRVPATSIEGNPEAVKIAEQIRDLEGRMRESEHTFRFRALSRQGFSDLTAQHPAREGQDERWNIDTFSLALIEACVIEPVMNKGQVAQLAAVLSDATFDVLFDAAWRANRIGPDVPFSRAASALLTNTEPN